MIRPLLFVLLLTLVGCDTLGPGPGSTLPDGPLLPVATGNAWTYTGDDGSTFTLGIGAAAEVAGEPYFRLTLVENGQTQTSDEYVRSVGQGVEFLYTAPLAGDDPYREATVYRYPVAVGTYEADRRQYTVERERLTVPAGTFEVVTYSGYDGNPEVSASFAPGVGMVRFNDGSTVRELVRYEVGE